MLMAVAQRIIPFLWFDDRAEESMALYSSRLPGVGN